MSNTRKTAARLVAQMQSWVGLKKADGSYQVILDTYNSLKPLPRGHKMNKTDAWCAATVTAAAVATGMTDIIPPECSCNKQIALFKALGCWQENEAVTPAPGWIIYYDWQDDGKGDSTGAADHVGVVEKVEGQTVTVIEGNYSGAVKRRTVKVNGRYIRGYGVPKYEAEAPDAPAPQHPFTGYVARVTPSNGLNVRTGPSTGAKKRGALSCGTKVTVHALSDDGKWGQITYKGAAGWICLAYTREVS